MYYLPISAVTGFAVPMGAGNAYTPANKAADGTTWRRPAPVRSVSDICDNPKTINRTGVYIYNIAYFIDKQIMYSLSLFCQQTGYVHSDYISSPHTCGGAGESITIVSFYYSLYTQIHICRSGVAYLGG